MQRYVEADSTFIILLHLCGKTDYVGIQSTESRLQTLPQMLRGIYQIACIKFCRNGFCTGVIALKFTSHYFRSGGYVHFPYPAMPVTGELTQDLLTAPGEEIDGQKDENSRAQQANQRGAVGCRVNDVAQPHT